MSIFTIKRMVALSTFISLLLSVYILHKFIALGLVCFQDCAYYYLTRNTFITYWLIEVIASLCSASALVLVLKKWKSFGVGFKLYCFLVLLFIAVITALNIRFLSEVPIKSYLDFVILF
jgi:hypothetical protein